MNSLKLASLSSEVRSDTYLLYTGAAAMAYAATQKDTVVGSSVRTVAKGTSVAVKEISNFDKTHGISTKAVG